MHHAFCGRVKRKDLVDKKIGSGGQESNSRALPRISGTYNWAVKGI